MNEELKFLLMDIELSYGIYYAYPSKKEQYLSASNLKYGQICVCAAFKFLSDKSVSAVKITDNKKQFKNDFRNDYVVAKKLHDVMSEADIIVTHNGDNFDIKHANVLFKKHGLGPIPPTKSIDTLKVARKYFNFPGNSLDQLSKMFGSNGKNKKPDWKKLTDGDEKEINVATTYCKNDVKELEKIFLELRPFIQNYPQIRNKSTLKSVPTHCPKCNSKNISSDGSTFRSSGRYKKYKCKDCFSHIPGEKTP